ncbi:MAG: hypothetical protein HDR55_03440 [Treponema sp.]|nr:hypothetical protein [Treponema sp.]MBD5406305.1 hypothetical protein [Treponema sp.]
MDIGFVTGVVSFAISCGSLLGVFIKFGSYRGRSDLRLDNLEEQSARHGDQIERLRGDINAVERTSANIDKKLEGLSSELKISMQFIKTELSEVKEMVRDAKEK